MAAHPPHRSALRVGRALTGAITALTVLLLAGEPEARPVPLEPARNVVTGLSQPYSLVSADLDRDGDLDLVGASLGSNQIAWYENNGTPAVSGWTAHVVSAAINGAISVSVADLDGDGDLDILFAAYLGDEVRWFENDGSPSNGGWNTRFIDISLNGPYSVCASDIDRDGDLDVLAAAHDANAFVVYMNNGAVPPVWTKRPIPAAGGPASVAAADLDADGDLDLIGALEGVDDVIWYQNNGNADPALWPKQTIDGSLDGAQSVAAADVDGDGHPDVVAAALNAGSVVWYRNDGTPADGGWTLQTIDPALAGASAAIAADFDTDGDIDILAAGQYADDVRWYENDGASLPVWTTRTIDPSADGAISVVAGDLDGDGDLDVAAALSLSGRFVWYRNATIHRSASFPSRHSIDASLLGGPSCVAADLDSDGDLDVVSVDVDLQQVAWQENVAGDGSSWTTRVIAGSILDPYSVFVADVDGDGDRDVLCAAFSADDVLWFENDGSPQNGGWIAHTIDSFADGAMSVCAADLDGDGDQDVAAAANNAGQFILYENDGAHPPAWTKRAISGAAGAAWVATADLDRDGDLDLLGAAQNADRISWYQNNGTWTLANWTIRSPDITFDGAQSVAAADVDGDGDPDLVASAFNAGDVVWYQNLNAVTNQWTKRFVDTSLGGASAAVAADLDGDGDLDLLATGQSANDVRWYESNGDSIPLFSTHIVASDLTGAYSVAAADLDGDGDLDVLGSTWFGSEPLVWFANQGGQFALATMSTAPSTLSQGQSDDVLKITVSHRGRTGDGDLELTTLDLLFEESAGDPLSSAEANALIANLYVYGDNGSGAFESGSDPLVATVGTLSLLAGHQTVPFVDGDPALQLAFGATKNYFVVPELTGNAASQLPDSFRVTHATESSSTAEDRSYDIPLLMEFASNVSSSIVHATGTTAVEDDAKVKAGFWVTSAMPSPGRVEFAFALPSAAPVRLTLFDLAGREVERLVDGECSAGTHRTSWDARREARSSGVWFARYESGGISIVRRVVVLR